MSTARLLVDYGIGPLPAGAGGVLAYNDLDLPGRVPLTDRVGLGRILTLPHILETPIEVRIARRDTLTGGVGRERPAPTRTAASRGSPYDRGFCVGPLALRCHGTAVPSHRS